MIRMGWICAMIAALMVFWHESNENPCVFCYLIGADVYAMLRTRNVRVAAVRSGDLASCSSPYVTSSTQFTTFEE
jgi:hypothetical protein